MSNTIYNIGFYLIELEENNYNLYNATTDKCILKEKSKEVITSFLNINCPNHSFLNNNNNNDNDIDNSYFNSLCATYPPDYIQPAGYSNIPKEISHPNYYGSLTSTSSYCYDLSGYENNKLEDSSQLEFDFTYNNKDSKDTDTINEEDLPYLGDNED